MLKDLFVTILIICFVVLVYVIGSLQLKSYTCERHGQSQG